MKKLIAFVLVLAMLLGIGASAEGILLGVSDIQAFENGEAQLDLTGFGVDLILAMDEAQTVGAYLSCDANGEVLANVKVAFDGDAAHLGYGSGSETTDVYYLSLDEIIALLNAAGDESLAQSASQIEEGRGMIVQALATIGEALEGVEPSGSASGSTVEVLLAAIPAERTSDGGEVEYNGETCRATMFEISEEEATAAVRSFAAQLDAVPELQEALEGESLAQTLEEVDLRVKPSGCIYLGENSDYVEFDVDMTADGETAQLSATIEDRPQERGEQYVVSLSFAADGESLAASFVLDFAFVEDDAWLQFDAASAVNLLDAIAAGDDGPLSKLESDVESLAMAVAMGAMNVISNNQLAGLSAAE